MLLAGFCVYHVFITVITAIAITVPPSVTLDKPFTVTWSRGQGELQDFSFFLADDNNQTLSGLSSTPDANGELSGQVPVTMSSGIYSPGRYRVQIYTSGLQPPPTYGSGPGNQGSSPDFQVLANGASSSSAQTSSTPSPASASSSSSASSSGTTSSTLGTTSLSQTTTSAAAVGSSSSASSAISTTSSSESSTSDLSSPSNSADAIGNGSSSSSSPTRNNTFTPPMATPGSSNRQLNSTSPSSPHGPTPNQNQNQNHSSSQKDVIIGAILGALFALFLMGGLVFVYCRRRNKPTIAFYRERMVRDIPPRLSEDFEYVDVDEKYPLPEA